MKNRNIKSCAATLLTVFALGGCDILDVNNPNSLVEE